MTAVPPPGGGAPEEGPAFRVMLRMRVLPGKEAEFERVWREVAEALRDHPANLGHRLLCSTEEPGVYYAMGDWTSEAAFRVLQHSEEHAGYRRRLLPYRSEIATTPLRFVAEVGPATGAGR